MWVNTTASLTTSTKTPPGAEHFLSTLFGIFLAGQRTADNGQADSSEQTKTGSVATTNMHGTAEGLAISLGLDVDTRSLSWLETWPLFYRNNGGRQALAKAAIINAPIPEIKAARNAIRSRHTQSNFASKTLNKKLSKKNICHVK